MGGLDPETSAELGGGRDCSLREPGPALGGTPHPLWAWAQGRDPSCLPPAAGTHALGMVAKAALQMDSVGAPSPLRFYAKRTPIITPAAATAQRVASRSKPLLTPTLRACGSG